MKDDERLVIQSLNKDIDLYSGDDFVKNFNDRIGFTISHLYTATLWLEELEPLVTEEYDKKALNRFIKNLKRNLKDWGVNYEHFCP